MRRLKIVYVQGICGGREGKKDGEEKTEKQTQNYPTVMSKEWRAYESDTPQNTAILCKKPPKPEGSSIST